MTIKAGEVNKPLYLAAGFDMSAFTLVTIKFTAPDGEVTEKDTTDPNVSVPATDSPALPGVGVLPASTYVLYITDGTVLTTEGDWVTCLQYEDAVPSLYFSDDATLSVGDPC